jgi:hypothetical protein
LREPLRTQGKDWFNRALFEDQLEDGFCNDLGDCADPKIEKPEVCDEFNVVCNYPMKPNAAGVAFLEMIKENVEKKVFVVLSKEICPFFSLTSRIAQSKFEVNHAIIYHLFYHKHRLCKKIFETKKIYIYITCSIFLDKKVNTYGPWTILRSPALF